MVQGGGSLPVREALCEEAAHTGMVSSSRSQDRRRALPAVIAIAVLASVAVLGFVTQPSEVHETELFGLADKWKADEDSMTLGVADDLAKASLRQSKASLTRDADFGRNMQLATKPAYSIGLGNRMSNLEAESQRLRLKEEQIRNEAKMYHTKAHFLRMQASSDVTDAKHELHRVYKLDTKLAGIKADSRKKTKMFHEGSVAVKEKHAQMVKLKKEAASVDAKVQKLKNKVALLMGKVHKDKTLEAKAKDKEDAERELLSSALVKRNRRVKRVDQVEGSLDRMQKRFDKAKHTVAGKTKV
mmetsp:Transcript_134046/g.199390  ORF Transcript_134046/g.199390 Transcript_134046/m.199390 type:complete len:300 (-) Transcript_134046:71-970(-)